MCISPISIKNPRYGAKLSKDSVNRFFDVTSQYIYVPFGHCSECIHNRQMSLVQRIQAEALDNYIFFATLTYNNESLPRLDINGYSIPFADISDLQNVFKRLRKSSAFGRRFRYVAVSELGSKRGRPHFHVLFMVPKFKEDDDNTPYNLEGTMFKALLSEWRRNYGSTRNPIYKPLCTYTRRFIRGKLYSNYDLHYVRPFNGSDGSSDVAFYVLKYMLKDSDRATRLQQSLRLNLDPDEYERVWSIVRPRYFTSLRFGLAPDQEGNPSSVVLSHLRKSIEVSKLQQDL